MNKYFASILLISSFCLTAVCAGQLSATPHPYLGSYADWQFEKVVGSKIKFKNGKIFDAHLYQLKYIGQVSNNIKPPFLIFSGRDCDECDANISIYIHSPGERNFIVGHGENTYPYPGTEKDVETNKLVYTSRVFYGEVLKGINGVIWYEHRILDNNKWGDFIFFVKIKNGKKNDVQLKNKKLLIETLEMLQNGFCKEIKGVNYTSEP